MNIFLPPFFQKVPTYRQLWYLPKYFSKKERTVFDIASVIFLLSLGYLLVQVYLGITIPIPKSGGQIVEGVVGEPKFVNPILAQTSDTDMDLSRLIFSGLLEVNPNQELVSDLAERYEISEDQKTYTLFLRRDVRFHDGDPFTADDVLLTFERILDPEFESPLAPLFRGVRVEKEDDYTLRFILKEPFTPFLSSLTFGILPEHRWQEILPENARLAELNLKPIGTGPLRFKKFVKDKTGHLKSYELERNSQYYRDVPFLEGMKLKFYVDLPTLLEAGKNHEIDTVSFVPPEEKEELLKRNRKLKYRALRLPQYAAIFFNQKNSLLKIKAIREALALGVDKERVIRETLRGEGEMTHGPILPGYVGYNAEIRKYEFNPEQARKILEESGWTIPPSLSGDPPSAVRKKGEEELVFSLSTIDRPEYLKTVEILQEAWKAIGIRVETKVYSARDIQKQVIKPRAYEALLFGEIIGTDPDPYPFWHSSQTRDPGLNLAVFYHKDIDQLLEEARKTSDLNARRLKYLHFQNLLAEELPAIFLYNPIYTYGFSKDLKGEEGRYITIPADRFSGIEHWYTKTSRVWRRR